MGLDFGMETNRAWKPGVIMENDVLSWRIALMNGG